MVAPVGAVTPLGAGTSLSEENIAQSTLAECTSLEVESDSPEGSVDGANTLSPTSRVPLGWAGGVLWPLPSVALIPTIWRGLGAGDGVWSQRDEEVPWHESVTPLTSGVEGTAKSLAKHLVTAWQWNIKV